MSVRSRIRLAAALLAMLLCVACGQVYRPVVIPCTAGTGVPGCPVVSSPTPANFHAVFGLSNNVPNGISPGVAGYPGGAMQIDVSGDTIIAETSLTATGEPNTGLNPTHMAISPNDSRVFVASASSALGGIDVVASFSPAFQSSAGSTFGPISAIALPSQTASVAAISESGNLVTVTLSAPLSSAQVGYTIVLQGVSNPAAGITAFSIASNVVTFQATNDFSPGQTVLISGLTAGSFMNGLTLTVLATDLSGSQFECNVTHANVNQTNDSGTAVPLQPAQQAYDGAYTLTSVSGTTIQYVNPVSGLPAVSGGQLTGSTATFPPQPVFVATTQNTAAYVANYNSNSVSAINTVSNSVSNSASVGVHPVSLAETPGVTNNGAPKLYVANEGSASISGSISSLNVTDLSSNAVSGFSGINPVWMVARGDSQKVYVVTQGDGKLITINTENDTAITPDCTATPALCLGAGANFIFYDSHLNRLYVVNPATGLVYLFSDTGGANDTPSPLTPGGITIPGLPATGTFSCATCSAPVPVSVTASPNGVGFYVASYQTAPAPCPDPNVSGACVIPELVAFDATSLTAVTGAMTLLTWAPAGTTPGPFATNQFAVPPVASCVPASLTALYTPTTPRFRVFTATAADSSSVYVSSCDAGIVAAINTTDNNPNGATGGDTPVNTLITDLPAPFSNGATQSNGEPPNQNLLFLLTGQ